MKKKLCTIPFAITLIFCLMLQFSVIASPQPTIYLDPSEYIFDADTVSIGHQFNVTIRVKDLAKLMMFQVYVIFNDDILNIVQFTGPVTGRTDAVRAWPNDDLGGRAWDPEYALYNKPGGMIGNPTYYHLGAGQGAVKIGDTLLGVATLDPTKTYKLACIEFNVTAMPSEGEKLSCTLGIDNADTYLYDTTGAIPDVTKEDGYYELFSGAPPTYDVTIEAYCNTNNEYVAVDITKDGSPTGYQTPHTFTGLEGEHTFTVPETNPHGHPFLEWNTGESSRTITVSSGGTYTAYYEEGPPIKTTLKVEPSEIIKPEMLPCSTFSINITIAAVENLQIVKFNLTYNTEILDMLGVNFHKVLDQTPKTKIISDDEAGYIWIQLTYTTPITTESPVALVTIEFHVTALGASPLNLQDSELLDAEGEPISHETEDGFFCTLIRDVAVVNVIPSRHWVYQGWLVNITVTVKNKGMMNETFEVKTFYNSNLIENVTIEDLPPSNETTITVVWNTQNVTACYNYTISAEATAVPYEFNITDNTYINGFVKIRFLGDVNGDDKVDMIDIYVVTQAFGSYPGHPRWNPDADMDQNNLIDMRDPYLTSRNFGKGCVP